MTALEMIAAVVGVLAWPAAVVAICWIVRGSLK